MRERRLISALHSFLLDDKGFVLFHYGFSSIVVVPVSKPPDLMRLVFCALPPPANHLSDSTHRDVCY